MLVSVLAAALGAVATAVVGSFVVNSDRLRSSAALDVGLLPSLSKAHAELVTNSMTRAATVAAVRSTIPALTLSECAALIASVVGIPTYAAMLGDVVPWLAATMAGLVTLTLLMIYGFATFQWCRRAEQRASTYAMVGLNGDAEEARRQSALSLVVQGVVVSFGLVLAFAIVGGLLGAASAVQSLLFFAAVGLAAAASYVPRRMATSAGRRRCDRAAGAPADDDGTGDKRPDGEETAN